ncbi:MAG: sulfate adenylyltransferase subunit CysN [Pseudomonadota bacterium]
MARKQDGTITEPTSISVEEWFEQQTAQDMLRFITCGSVDDGKSTLIGRLLWDSQKIYDDQLENLEADSKRHSTQSGEIDLALLVDGLAAEREQGITIDVAYRFFSTPNRKFIVADTPGHEQYTRNMVTGASTADVAILLVDARQGILVQTRRHSYLVSLMGIKNVVLAVNKMDLVDFSQETYDAIVTDFHEMSKDLSFKDVTAVPVSALTGDNVTERSANTHWYSGPTLMGYLETVKLEASKDDRLVFPVQWVNRPTSDFRGFSGTLSGGNMSIGDEIRVVKSGQTAKVKSLVTFDGDLQSAQTGDAITLVLDREVDASRGDVISSAKDPLETTDQFEATIIWMHEETGHIGRNYDIKLANQWTSASITSVKHRVEVNTWVYESCRQLELNDIAVCNLALSSPVAFDSYTNNQQMGGFILVDKFTKTTVAAGLIQHSLRRAQNIHRHSSSVARADRERLNGHPGKVLWFTGLSGSGKSTIANAFEKRLNEEGIRTFLLDGDNIRHGLNKDLGFTEADRVENIRRVAEVTKLMMDAGIVVLTAFISPFRSEREMAKAMFQEGEFSEIFVSTPLEVAEARDPKGLYKKARSGEIPNFTGIDSPYEEPENPDLKLDTAEQSIQECVDVLMKNFRN